MILYSWDAPSSQWQLKGYRDPLLNIYNTIQALTGILGGASSFFPFNIQPYRNCSEVGVWLALIGTSMSWGFSPGIFSVCLMLTNGISVCSILVRPSIYVYCVFAISIITVYQAYVQ